MTELIKNVAVVGPNSISEHGWVLLHDSRIDSVGGGPPPSVKADRTLDGQGAYLTPGFVDLHVHGGGGADFCDGEESAWLTALATHLRGGTTTIVPTLMSTDLDCMLANSRIYANLQARRGATADLPHLGGMHLEGPYFSPEQLGAQDPKALRAPAPAEYERILAEAPCIRRWAAACELPGALAFGDRLREAGVTACIGHSNATSAEVFAAARHGYRCVTHLYSGCSMVHRNGPFREGGVVEAAFLLDELDVEVIGDGIHLPPELLRLILRIKGPDRIALITDCIRPGGQGLREPALSYSDRLRTRPVLVEAGVAMMPDRKSFAGSIATMSHVVQTAVRSMGATLWEAVRMASLTPARMLGLERRIGSIEPGKQADLLLLDRELRVRRVILSQDRRAAVHLDLSADTDPTKRNELL